MLLWYITITLQMGIVVATSCTVFIDLLLIGLRQRSVCCCFRCVFVFQEKEKERGKSVLKREEEKREKLIYWVRDMRITASWVNQRRKYRQICLPWLLDDFLWWWWWCFFLFLIIILRFNIDGGGSSTLGSNGCESSGWSNNISPNISRQ